MKFPSINLEIASRMPLHPIAEIAQDALGLELIRSRYSANIQPSCRSQSWHSSRMSLLVS